GGPGRGGHRHPRHPGRAGAGQGEAAGAGRGGRPGAGGRSGHRARHDVPDVGRRAAGRHAGRAGAVPGRRGGGAADGPGPVPGGPGDPAGGDAGERDGGGRVPAGGSSRGAVGAGDRERLGRGARRPVDGDGSSGGDRRGGPGRSAAAGARGRPAVPGAPAPARRGAGRSPGPGAAAAAAANPRARRGGDRPRRRRHPGPGAGRRGGPPGTRRRRDVVTTPGTPGTPGPPGAPEVLAATLGPLAKERKVVVCCGPGGVGKTTVSATFALQAARQGRRACVVTVDPARRLADALGVESLPNTPAVVPGDWSGELYALMLDTKGTFDDLVRQYSKTEEQAASIQANRLYQNLAGALSGTQEYMAMEKLYELTDGGDYDVVVVDTPPTRNALDLLDAPRRLTQFLENRLFRALLLPTRAGLRAVGVATRAVLRTISKVAGAEIV